MKKITVFLLFFLLTSLSSSFAGSSKDKDVKIKTSAICGMCKARIERNLGLSKGVKEATLDVKTKVVTVKYNPDKTDENTIRSIISKTGYDADDVPAVQSAHDKLPSCCRKTAANH